MISGGVFARLVMIGTVNIVNTVQLKGIGQVIVAAMTLLVDKYDILFNARTVAYWSLGTALYFLKWLRR